jgi:hypothetical protein
MHLVEPLLRKVVMTSTNVRQAQLMSLRRWVASVS